MAKQSIDDLLRQRLGIIQDQGINSTQSFVERITNQRNEEAQSREIERQRLEKVAQLKAQQSTTVDNSAVPTSTGSKGGSDFEKFVKAIQGQESGGNYGARNSSSGALGKYQIMPANLAGKKTGWDYEATGKDYSASQFLGSPEIQDAVARYKLKGYYDKYGAAGAAVAWYAGPGTARKYMKNNGNYTRKQGNYPSINSYAQSILRRMGQG